MSKIVGIDLGTTNSGVAIVRDGMPVMLPHGTERIIPSVVGYSPDGQWLVGTPARNQYVFSPENTVRSIKRQMGTATRVTLAEREFTPPELSAFILRQLKEVAEQQLGEPVMDAVITVPAYFSDAARQATRDAGEIAGFNVRRIINEPTAAALAYGLNMVDDQLALVYDLGGGTFDVSLVEMTGGVVEVRASHGNTLLGGDDFDERLAVLLAERFKEEHGIDLQQERRAWARLQRAAELAKMTLSAQPFTWVKEEFIAEKRGVPLHLNYEVSRHEFEEAIDDLLQQTLESIDRVLEDAQVQAQDLSQVLLVGGSTRIPAVWELVADYVGLEPQMTINPEEAVALGAGVQAAIIAGEPIDAILVDVTPHSLGIAVADVRMGRLVTDRFQVLIRRNSTVPVSKSEVFHTVYPTQTTIKIEVYQGESPIASENTSLGEFLINDLEPERPGELASVTVQFDMDINGILQVTAQDRKSKKQEKITVEASATRMSEMEILAAKRWTTISIVALTEEQLALIERSKALLSSGSLSLEQQQQLNALLEEVHVAQTSGEQSLLEELLEELLDLLFDWEDA